ncbi:MAG TPA: DUF72 domain-containing protein [Tepidisphaeraceae bacterium]|nr:DUF72 domain-containing protein [Tepidisphaeraceae bacterium]
MPQTRIGISGWRYTPWRGTFYPKGLTQKNELSYASRCLNSIEINGSFYSLQRPSSYQTWYEQTPDDFVFSLKGGRYITHMKRLREADDAIANYFASGVLRLREKLGPILWQFSPNFKFDADLFRAFFKKLPRNTREAATIAKHHSKLLRGRSETKTDANRPMRHAVEFRHESFLTPKFIELLGEFNISLVIADTARRFPYIEDITADFVYLRLHGDEELYVSGYSEAALDRWEARIKKWRSGTEPRDARRVAKKSSRMAKGRDVYVYFDNDAKVHAPFDAINLAKRLGLKIEPPQDIKRVGAY